jgi:hypothetical protein
VIRWSLYEAADEKQMCSGPKGSLANSFGLWKDTAVDGVDYQERLRVEWTIEATMNASGSRYRAKAHSCRDDAAS